MLGPSGLKTRRLELLSHELLHARFQELDEESILDAGRLIGRMHKKIRNYGFRVLEDSKIQPVMTKAAQKRRVPSPRKAKNKRRKK